MIIYRTAATIDGSVGKSIIFVLLTRVQTQEWVLGDSRTITCPPARSGHQYGRHSALLQGRDRNGNTYFFPTPYCKCSKFQVQVKYFAHSTSFKMRIKANRQQLTNYSS